MALYSYGVYSSDKIKLWPCHRHARRHRHLSSFVVMAYVLTAHVRLACLFMASVVMDFAVMTYIVKAYIDLTLYSYGLYDYGPKIVFVACIVMALYSYGLTQLLPFCTKLRQGHFFSPIETRSSLPYI